MFEINKALPTNLMAAALLRLMAAQFNLRPSLRRYLRCSDGWIDFSVGFETDDGGVEQFVVIREGRMRVSGAIGRDADVVARFSNDETLREMLASTPNESLTLILRNRMIVEGNLSYLQLFNFLVSLLLGKTHQRSLERTRRDERQARCREYGGLSPSVGAELAARRKVRLRAESRDPGVAYLPDQYLSEYGLDDFPRLQGFLREHFDETPQICAERPRLLTEWYRSNGFEHGPGGRPWDPLLRQARALAYLLERRKPIIAKNSLIAGTSTSKQPTGVILYPDAQATMIWGELLSVGQRLLNPYRVSSEDIETLHDVFPYWAKRNFREWVRREPGDPLCLQIDGRWAFYFVWKSVGISHTIPNFARVLRQGIDGIIGGIQTEIDAGDAPDDGAGHTLEAMSIALRGVSAYARNLSVEAMKLAGVETDPQRKSELERLAQICAKVPAGPAETLDEAVNAIWILWVAIHMENTNTGLSIGRLDQLLQPYFAADMARLGSEAERRAYIEHAIELVGCFYMRGTDHLPLVPDLGNYLFGGSSSDQAITLGGVTPGGDDAVCDMTYICLKVTEMLCIRDPNVNARYHPKNSEAYLKRLCEVNFITAATPSMHNDEAVFRALEQHGYPSQDVRDWSATGCVEPTLSGRHMGHTGSILMNLVAALEMALNDGRHPGMKWNLGPKTGSVDDGDFATFDDFFEAYATQQRFLIGHAVELNNRLAAVHARERPTPLLSALIDGCIDKRRDVTGGGALYNTSGTSNIGLADVVDSLMVIKKLVFDEKRIALADLKRAVDGDFANDPAIDALVRSRAALFGSGDPEAARMAHRVMSLVHDTYGAHVNFRGGRYTSGFWSMSQHVAYGTLSGALPSGRRAHKAFTPGLTPHAAASRSFLDNIRDVAALDAPTMDNNIAFNVKLTPSPSDTRAEVVDHMHAYVKTYFEQGGMQMQFNVMTADVLEDAMANPENYKDLLVRISGYNAYFVTLNREMQVELIERAEYGV
ncbi:MAG: formate acetyltransferase [Deltaproteobacteria bacterium]|nr:formate acetyltransferase [Deltaproteobacteria bacterium]